jgi:crotonobetainyl-CoA:carnitine CoA-transferase CaiB-like acyl-CoA transferase
MLGQHTDDVLKDMGLSAASIAELRREEVVS